MQMAKTMQATETSDQTWRLVRKQQMKKLTLKQKLPTMHV